SGEDLERQIAFWADQDYRDDYSRYLLRNAWSKQYFADIESSADKNKLRASFGFDDQSGTQVRSSSERYTFRLVNETTFGEKFGLTINMSYTESANRGSASFPADNLNPGGTRTAIYPYARLADESGNPLVIPKNMNLTFADTAGMGRLLDWKYKPLDDVHMSSATTRTGHVAANLRLSYKIAQPLRTELTYGYENQSTNTALLYEEESFYARDLINRYSQIANGN